MGGWDVDTSIFEFVPLSTIRELWAVASRQMLLTGLFRISVQFGKGLDKRCRLQDFRSLAARSPLQAYSNLDLLT